MEEKWISSVVSCSGMQQRKLYLSSYYLRQMEQVVRRKISLNKSDKWDAQIEVLKIMMIYKSIVVDNKVCPCTCNGQNIVSCLT